MGSTQRICHPSRSREIARFLSNEHERTNGRVFGVGCLTVPYEQLVCKSVRKLSDPWVFTRACVFGRVEATPGLAHKFQRVHTLDTVSAVIQEVPVERPGRFQCEHLGCFLPWSRQAPRF